MAVEIEKSEVRKIGEVLLDGNRPLPNRFRALFTLRNIGGNEAITQISNCFTDSSALLKHECAYCLGQMQNEYAVPILASLLQDDSQEVVVRHEAGEALGAIAMRSNDITELLKKFCNDSVREIAETCYLAIKRIQWSHSDDKMEEKLSNCQFKSIDPAPPSGEIDINKLSTILMNDEEDLFERYRALFSLRNLANEDSVRALATGLDVDGPLIKHEIAYVLGQLQHEAAIENLARHLEDTMEHPIVRHECAEALGSIATDGCIKLLHQYLSDAEPLVRESCIVALDICEYEQNCDFQYANTLAKVKESS